MQEGASIPAHILPFTRSINNLFPPELLGRIFLLCAREPAYNTDGNPVPIDATDPPLCSPQTYPLKLTLVCPYWRDVALSLPQLWQGATFTFKPVGRQGRLLSPSFDTRVLQLWAERSRDLPFSLALRYLHRQRDEDVPFEEEGMREMAQVIQGTLARRLRSWVIAMPPQHINLLLYVLDNVAFPTLRTLKVVSDTDIFHLAMPSVNLNNTPSLKHVTLRGPYLQLTQVVNNALNLSRMHLEECAGADILLQVLQNFYPMFVPPNVRIMFKSGVALPDVELEVLQFYTIEQLTLIDASTDEQIGYFLSHVDLAVLEDLTIITLRDPEEDEWPYLSEFLIRSDPPLRQLTVLGTSMCYEDFYQCIGTMPGLEELTADDRLLTPRILNALRTWPPEVVHANRTVICMELRSVTFRDCHTCTAENVMEMVLSRIGDGPQNRYHIAPLERIRLIDCSEDLQRLPYMGPIRRLMESGALRVEIA